MIIKLVKNKKIKNIHLVILVQNLQFRSNHIMKMKNLKIIIKVKYPLIHLLLMKILHHLLKVKIIIKNFPKKIKNFNKIKK